MKLPPPRCYAFVLLLSVLAAGQEMISWRVVGLIAEIAVFSGLLMLVPRHRGIAASANGRCKRCGAFTPAERV
ncbi:MAG: hypothetical protein ABMA13_22900 [Chthoniobacteraceae bacterium]